MILRERSPPGQLVNPPRQWVNPHFRAHPSPKTNLMSTSFFSHNFKKQKFGKPLSPHALTTMVYNKPKPAHPRPKYNVLKTVECGKTHVQSCRKNFQRSNFMMMPDDSNFESVDWLMMIKNDFEKTAQ